MTSAGKFKSSPLEKTPAVLGHWIATYEYYTQTPKGVYNK